MTDKIKEKVLEFAAIAKECPESLQVKCFELLLSHYLNQLTTKPEKKQDDKKNEAKPPADEKPSDESRSQEDLLERDVHVKVRQFLKKSNLTVSHLNQIFYKEGEEIKPLYDDLKTTKAAESQVRIALLHALKNSITTGDFQFDGEDVRKETQVRKCYDAPNFTTNFKNNKVLFDNFDGYDKSQPKVTLSSQGKEKLAALIQELQ
jgi:anti-sigma28 factor (negative regulator of flagellin synthesis)